MVTETFESRVDGMICPQCEDEIAHALLLRRGVTGCDVSYRKSRVTAEYDPQLISPDEIEKALAAMGYPPGDGKSGRRADIAAVIAVAVLYFAVPALTGLVRVPAAESGAGSRRSLYDRGAERRTLYRDVRRHNALPGRRAPL